MSYAITNGKGLAGVGHPGTSRLVTGNVLGGMTGDKSPVTVDGTTTGDREMMIAALSMQVAEWQHTMQQVLDGKLSLTSTIFRPVGGSVTGRAMDIRGFMQTAKAKLSSEFLPIVSAALRDYNRATKEVMETATEYLRTVAAQFQCLLDAEAQATLKAFAKEVKAAAITNANALLSAARDAGKGATDGVFPFWVGPVAGVFVLAYLWNTFRVR